MSLIFYTTVIAETQKELFDKGVLLFKQGQHQKAIETFSKLIEIAPGNADAYKNRGVSYMKQEKFDLAIEDFEKAKELFPELKGLYSNLGVAWYCKKKITKAIENYSIELNLKPDQYYLFFNRALCYAEIKQNEKALEDVSRALELKPDFNLARCFKGDILMRLKRGEQAKEAYEEAASSLHAQKKIEQLKQTKKTKPVTPQTSKSNSAVPESEPAPKKKPEMAAAKLKGKFTLQVGAFLNKEYALIAIEEHEENIYIKNFMSFKFFMVNKFASNKD